MSCVLCICILIGTHHMRSGGEISIYGVILTQFISNSRAFWILDFQIKDAQAVQCVIEIESH